MLAGDRQALLRNFVDDNELVNGTKREGTF
jgi:hypothetical protein